MKNYCSRCGERACFCPEAAKRPSVIWNGMCDDWDAFLAEARPDGAFGHLDIEPDDDAAIADTHPQGEDAQQASSLMSGGGSREREPRLLLHPSWVEPVRHHEAQQTHHSGKETEVTKEVDISSEEFRVYTYADGSTFRIEQPATLHVIEDDKGVTHRVVDKAGVTHRPERNFIGISWKPAEGQPAFVA